METSGDGSNFMNTLQWLGPLLLAVAALAQPWVIGFWNRFVRQPSVDVYETGLIDVGFSVIGATIGLQGTLRPIHLDQFIRSITLVLVRVSDGARHEYEWVGLRAPGAAVPGLEPANQQVELPAGFMLRTADPRRYNYVFADRKVEAEIKTVLGPLQAGWNEAFVAALPSPFPANAPPNLVAGISADTFNTFSQSSQYVNAYTELDRICYWSAGQYRVEMSVNTARPSASFKSVWMFELTADDVSRIRQNRLTMARSTCGQGASLYNFAYVPYLATSA